MTHRAIPTPMLLPIVVVQLLPIPQLYLQRVIRPTEMPITLLLMPPDPQAPVHVPR